MNHLRKQSGFAVLEALLVVVVVVLVCYVAIRANAQNKSRTETVKLPGYAASLTADIPDAPNIETVEDLDKALRVLDRIDADQGRDRQELNSNLDF